MNSYISFRFTSYYTCFSTHRLKRHVYHPRTDAHSTGGGNYLHYFLPLSPLFVPCRGTLRGIFPRTVFSPHCTGRRNRCFLPYRDGGEGGGSRSQRNDDSHHSIWKRKESIFIYIIKVAFINYEKAYDSVHDCKFIEILNKHWHFQSRSEIYGISSHCTRRNCKNIYRNLTTVWYI